MNKVLVAILILSLIGCAVGGVYTYKYFKLKVWFAESQVQLTEAMTAVRNLHQQIDDYTGRLDKDKLNRAIFLHHSIGEGILTAGNLRTRMLEDLGVLVKSATYGDDLGENTDVKDWAGKFSDQMDEILTFSYHPNHYDSDGTMNDVVIFKSCFPNSDVESEGTEPGDPHSETRTVANYKAVFEVLKQKMAEHPDRLFIYMTAPPLLPQLTTPANAARAREFNDWLMEQFVPQYRSESGLNNFAVFDLFDVLAGSDNVLRPEYRLALPDNPHPAKAGCVAAADKFMEFFTPLWTDWQKAKKS